MTGIKCWCKTRPDDLEYKLKLYLHREDGPARIWPMSGKVEWWYENIYYSGPETMPLQLFLGYCKWEYKRK